MEATQTGASHGAASVAENLTAVEEAAKKLQEELAMVLDGLADLRHSVKAAEETAGDRQSDLLRKEVTDVLRQQATGLDDMSRAVQALPRRWARFELQTSQRKSLMLNIKARQRQEKQFREEGKP